MKIAFVGGGHMAAALIAGLDGRAELQVVDRNKDKRAALAQQFAVTAAADVDAVYGADVTVLAVRPAQVAAVCGALDAARCGCVVSVAAGVRTAAMRRWLGAGDYALVRAMPNTPAQVGLGMTLCYADSAACVSAAKAETRAVDSADAATDSAVANSATTARAAAARVAATQAATRVSAAQTDTQAMDSAGAATDSAVADSAMAAREEKARVSAARAAVDFVFGAVGQVVWLDAEAEIDAATAISGSGPAYVYYFIEGMQKAAAKLGLSDELSLRLILQTLRGAVEMTAQSPHTPAELAQRVAVKGGTTERALAVMAKADLHKILEEAIIACAERARTLGQDLSK